MTSLHFSVNRLHYINVLIVVGRSAPRSIECAISLQCWLVIWLSCFIFAFSFMFFLLFFFFPRARRWTELWKSREVSFDTTRKLSEAGTFCPSWRPTCSRRRSRHNMAFFTRRRLITLHVSIWILSFCLLPLKPVSFKIRALILALF